jgi:acyl-coenzyme A synthetase/AMP-(fatty) acid ligase
MVVLPFFYSYGNSILMSHFAVHATLVVHQNLVYPNSVLDMMKKENVTGFSGVPSTYAILLNRSSIRNHRFPNLTYLAQAGGAMSPKLAQELKTILPDVNIFIMYGQTEASARLSYLDPHKLLLKAGSIGKAIPGVTLHLLKPEGKPVTVGETGEIVAQGENIMAGYWEDPAATKSVLREEGLWTGDLARIDDEGYLYIVSRKSELIKSGAHRIGPKEIEEVILEHESVHEVAVFGIEDEILGEAIKACIVLKDHAACTKKQMMRHCRQNLPAYKVPHHFEFLKQLPKTASGKIKKNELKHMLHHVK